MFRRIAYNSMLRTGIITAVLLIVAGACAPSVGPSADGSSSPAPTNQNTPSMADLEGTKWILAGYGPVDDPVAPVAEITAAFDNQGEMHGSAGCNNYFTEYELSGQSFTIAEVEKTAMDCPEEGVMEQEAAFTAALASAQSLTLDGDTLIITYDGQALRFTAVPPPAHTPLTGTQWQLTSFDSDGSVQPTMSGTQITAEFAEGQVRGTAGCNQYGAEYEVDGQTLTIGEVAQTAMECPEEGVMEQEAAYLVALRSVKTYTIDDDTLTLVYDGGVLHFTRMQPTAD